MQSLECRNLPYFSDCIITLIKSAGVVKKATAKPAKAPFSIPSTKDRFCLPLYSLYLSQAANRTELVNGSVNSGQQMPVNNWAKPQCLMMYLRVSLMFLSSGLSCILTLTVSKKKPETQLTTPETIPLVKSMMKFMSFEQLNQTHQTIIFTQILSTQLILKVAYSKSKMEEYLNENIGIYWFLSFVV